MRIDWRYEVPQLVVLAAMFIAAAVCWPLVPDRMPVHWNLAGGVDRYGGKLEGMLLIPLISVGLYGLFWVLPLIDPGRANYAGFWRAYTVIRCLLIGFMAAVYAAILTTALGVPLAMGRLISLAVGVLLVVLGNYMGKIRPNWFVGVRTPWTLSSKVSWTKTHRLAGWLFMVAGAIFLLHACLNAGWLMMANLVYGTTALLWLVVYSYWLWRNDPDRTPPAGTSPV